MTKVKKKTTVPISIYLITLLISFVLVLLFIIRQIVCCEIWVAEILLSIGAGGVSSTIVAFVIDIANTKKQQDDEKKLFERLTSNFDMACEDLLTYFIVGAQEVYGIDDEKRTYNEWAAMLLGDDNADEGVLHEADYSLQQIGEIERNARRLLSDSRIHISNNYFDDDFTKKIKKIQKYCQSIEYEHKRGKYQNCLGIITKHLIKTLIEYKPSMTSIFEEPFNWDEE